MAEIPLKNRQALEASRDVSRRSLLKAGAAAGASMILPGRAFTQQTLPAAPGPALQVAGQRFLTYNAVIRVNQIEVTRDRNEGVDESDRNTPQNVAMMRDAFAKGWPGGQITWAFSWRALQDQRPNYREIRQLVRSFHERYGDQVTFIPGGYFPNAYSTREQVSRDLHEGLAMASDIVGGGYRPNSVVAGFLAAENLAYLAEKENIHVCQGNIWSQYAIDNQDGDGSICYPYYPSREHFCKPAQSPSDFIDCVNLDGWTVDFVAGRREGFKDGFNSRLGVGPIETFMAHGPEIGLKEIMETSAVHFDTGFKENGWAWLTTCWEVCLIPKLVRPECLTTWLSETRKRWPEAKCVNQGDFGLAWRRAYPDNRAIDYRFVQRGSGIGGSDANLEIRWFMNSSFRLALLRDFKADTPFKVIDFTRYDLPAEEPRELTRRWSLLGQINQKQTRPQDKPVLLTELPEDQQKLILRRYPELQAMCKKS